MREIERKYLHMLFAVACIGMIYFFGKTASIIVLFIILVIGSIIINQKILGKKIPFIDPIVMLFERENVRFIGYGSAWFVAGCLFSIIFTSNINYAIAIIWILGFGDGLSGIFGKLGTKKLFYNKNKTLEGMFGFFIGSVPSILIIGSIAIPLSILCMIAESIETPLDDNIIIPIVGAMFLGFFA
ncbi:MAG: hypothetical protein WC501_04965 [Candidatus Micrarchaeia archaeon]